MASVAEEVQEGTDIDAVAKAMKASGYRETQLELMVWDEELSLKFWVVNEGALIATYSIETKKVTALSYWFCDERAKAVRKTFSLPVISFDPASGVMKINTKNKDK